MPLPSDKKIRVLFDNWLGEKESALLYRVVSQHEKDAGRKSIFRKLSRIEQEHANLWEEELKRRYVKLLFKPRFKIRILIFLHYE